MLSLRGGNLPRTDCGSDQVNLTCNALFPWLHCWASHLDQGLSCESCDWDHPQSTDSLNPIYGTPPHMFASAVLPVAYILTVYSGFFSSVYSPLSLLYLRYGLLAPRGLSSSAGGRSRCSSPSPRASGRFSAGLPPVSATYLPTERDREESLRRPGPRRSEGARTLLRLFSGCPKAVGRLDRAYSGGSSALSMALMRSRPLQASDFLASPAAPTHRTCSSCTHRTRWCGWEEFSLRCPSAIPPTCSGSFAKM